MITLIIVIIIQKVIRLGETHKIIQISYHMDKRNKESLSVPYINLEALNLILMIQFLMHLTIME